MKDSALPPGRNSTGNESYSTSIAHEKHERLARTSLHDLIHFNELLDSEITRLQYNTDLNAEEHELLERMLVTKNKFDLAIHGMKTATSESGRHALLCFADSVQDLITFIYKTKAN